ncbi:MAG: hypothetical protein LBR23_02160 [Spirochaetaceae bacterium]|nr:hypothetical protein [Spirochaetaceae bacterium]
MNGILKDPKPMTVLTDKGSFEFTPKTELAELLIKCRNSAFRKGELQAFTVDEGLKALEEERAGYDGLGKLWGKSENTLTPA